MIHGLRKVRTLARVLTGRELLVRPDVHCTKERFGSDYGGWDVATRTINSQSVVYSFGIGEDATFDTALIERYDLTVHAFDPTPKSIKWVDGQRFSNRFVMHTYGLAAVDGEIPFHPPDNPKHVSHTILDGSSTKAKAILFPVKRLATILKELAHDRVDILKMDIEGAEYDVIEDIGNSYIRPDQILVEFHHRAPGVGIGRTREAIQRLQSMGYRLFSVSANNEEMCFILDPRQVSPAKAGGTPIRTSGPMISPR